MRYLILRFGWVPLGLFLSLWILAGTTNLVAWADRPEFSSPFKLTLALYFCIFSFLYVVGTRFLDIRNPALPPWQKVVIPQTWKLYAIRSPQDEASIAITTSQFVNLCLDLFFQRILVGPFRWASRIMGLGLGEDGLKVLFIYILPIEVIGIISINIADAYYSTDSTALLISLVIALAPVAIFLMSIVIVIYATLLGSLVLIPANLILAVALGGDLWRSGGLADVECEPMPSGVTGVVSMIRISAEDRKELGMVHFLHATKAARERVAAIINDMHT